MISFLVEIFMGLLYLAVFSPPFSLALSLPLSHYLSPPLNLPSHSLSFLLVLSFLFTLSLSFSLSLLPSPSLSPSFFLSLLSFALLPSPSLCARAIQVFNCTKIWICFHCFSLFRFNILSFLAKSITNKCIQPSLPPPFTPYTLRPHPGCAF